MDAIVVYSPVSSNRLTYVLDWLFKERLQLPYRISHNINDLGTASIIYDPIFNLPAVNGIFMPASGLLSETDIKQFTPDTGEWNGMPTLFATRAPGYTISFDLFSAIFYLLSRYEEYYSYVPDKHGRYPAAESILFQQGWLAEPIVDEWVTAFGKLITSKLGIVVTATPYCYLPTYDIDIAYSHAYKGIARIAGAYLRALLKGDVHQINERTQVLKKKKTDPYDSFAWLRQLHYDCNYRPVYFILSALKTSAFDRNIHPLHPAMVRVIKQMDKDGDSGIHPSYFATDKAVFEKEKSTLEDITGHKVVLSRQHYIKLKIPATYRLLTQCGIAADYSMGYGAHLGFRAGTGSSFLWYDIENEQVSHLRVHPFCFMDTTAHFELGLPTEQAFEALKGMGEQLKENNSTLITIFHNFSLGTAREWHGWPEAYKKFMMQESGLFPKDV